MSREDAEAALKLSLAIKSLWGVATSLKNAFAAAVSPMLSGFAEGVKNVLKSIREWVKGHQELVRSAFTGATAVLGFGAALFVAGKGIGLVAGVLTRVSGAIGVLASGVGHAAATDLAVRQEGPRHLGHDEQSQVPRLRARRGPLPLRRGRQPGQ